MLVSAVSSFQRRSRASSVSASTTSGSSSNTYTTNGSGASTSSNDADTHTLQEDDDDDNPSLDTESLYTLCSQQESESGLTVSDLPGAGRTLGLLYARWGRALEASVGRLAHRNGHGPDAVAEQIARMTFVGTRILGAELEPNDHRNRVFKFVEWKVAHDDEAKLRACCQKLVGYTASSTQLTRMRALEQIIQLITAQPRFRPYFRDPALLSRIRDVMRSTSINSDNSEDWEAELELHKDNVFLARQALLCIEQNQLNEVVDNVLQLPFVQCNRAMRREQYSLVMLKLLEYCRNPQVAFAAKRFMYSALNFLSWGRIANGDNSCFWSELVVFIEQAVMQSLDAGADGAADIEGTERLVVTLLLPRCRALHTLDASLYSHRNVGCRCIRNGVAMDEMRPMLDMLRRPGAQDRFPRAAVIAEEVWSPLRDG
ncbi:hypothetical protein M0805_003126 [Coniferiporia weirii]|nr:hypothetical protein M0805_003126 [Coniferiporia weirii]